MAELIAFFSRRGENYVNGMIKRLEEGNTEVLAKEIQNETGADLFQIEPILAYPEDYSACIDEAKQDQRRDARPELKFWPEDMEISGKVIKPFCTHEGSGFGKSMEDIKRLCPGAEVVPGLEVHGRIGTSQRALLRRWICMESEETK